MVLRKEIAFRIKDLLKENPQGMSITDIVKGVKINRNTAGRYLENLLVSGQVEMRRFGMAKIYMLSQRIPLSAVLSLSSELVVQLDTHLRIIFANGPFLNLMGTDLNSLLGKNIEYTPVALVFDEAFTGFIENVKEGISGKEWEGEIVLTKKGIIVFCRIAPTVFEDGRKGVSVILEDITEKKQAEKELQQSEDRYRSLVEISPDAVIIHQEGKIIFMNNAALKMIGASHTKEIIGKNVLDFIQFEFRDSVRRNIQKDLSGDTTPPIELQMLRLDGAPILVEGRGVKTNIDGKPAIQVALRDITERKLMEEILRKNEEQYRSLVETTGTGYVILDKDGRVISANQEYLRLTGRSTHAEIEGRSVIDWTASYDIERNAREIEQIFRKGRVRDFEIDYQRPDGTIQPIEINASVIPSNPDPIIVTLCRDITERRRTEIALQKSEDLYRTLSESSSDLIFMIGREDRVEYVNSYAYRLLNKPVEQIIGHPRSSLFPPEVAINQKNALERVFEIGNPVRTEGAITFGGRIHWFDHYLTPLKGADNRVRSVLGISRDITEKKQAETALWESEEKYRNIINRANDVICIIQDGFVKMCNPRITELWGGTSEEIIGRHFSDFIHPDARSEVIARYNRRMAGENLPQIYETIFMRKDGSRSYVELNAGLILFEGKTANLVIVRDINDRRKSDLALRESEERLRFLLDGTEDLIFMQDPEGRYLYFNAPARYGVSGEMILGSTPYDLLDNDVADRIVKRVKNVAKTGQSIREETPLVWKGQTLWFSDNLSPYRDANGTITAVLTISHNITERKRAERALHENEEKYRSLVTTTGDIIWETDDQVHFVFVSPQVESIVGYKPDELIGHARFEFLKPDAIEPNQRMFRKAIENKEKSIIYLSHWIHKNGHSVYLESHAVPIYRSDGSFSGFFGIDRKKTA